MVAGSVQFRIVLQHFWHFEVSLVFVICGERSAASIRYGSITSVVSTWSLTLAQYLWRLSELLRERPAMASLELQHLLDWLYPGSHGSAHRSDHRTDI